MTAPKAPLAKPRAISPAWALMLSAIVLPGLGQLVTGRLGKGAAMAVVPLIWLPIAAFKLMRDLYKVMPELTSQLNAGAKITFYDIHMALKPMAGSLLWLFAPLIAVWLWSLIDSTLYLVESRSKAEGAI